MNLKINKDAPAVHSEEIVINAPPEKVWRVLADINAWSSWNSRIGDSRISEQPSVGSTFTWKNSGYKIKSKIHTFEQNESIGWTGKAFGASAIHNWHLTPVGTATKVMAEESMEGWLVGLMRKKMNSTLQSDMVYWLEQLKRKCEE